MASKVCLSLMMGIALLAFGLKAAIAAELSLGERTAAEQVVAAINRARAENKPAALERLLSSELTNAEHAAIVQSEKALCDGARQIFSEVTVPQLKIGDMRAITPEVIEVEAMNVQFGSLIMSRSWAVLVILKKEGSDWRVLAIRNVGLPQQGNFQLIG